jgi:hypothetical protein
MKKKSLPNTNLYLKELEKKSKIPKFKSKPKNSSSSKRNNAYNLNETLFEKELNKLLKPYKDFVKKNFKNYQFDFENNGKDKKTEKFSNKNPNKNDDFFNNIINIKDTNSNFENFLENIKPDFLEENIVCEIPDIPDLFSFGNKLGKHKNNKNDYITRKERLIKDNELIINEDLDINFPLEEENTEENELIEDKNIDIIREGLNVDQIVPEGLVSLNDQEEIMKRKIGINIIIDIWKTRRKKELIFIGVDPTDKKSFLRIYGKKFDKDGKIKVIEINNYLKILDDIFFFELSVKEIFNVDSMSKEEILPRIGEVINKYKEARD